MENNKVFVDTHCHLDDPQFAEDLNEVIERAKAAGVTRIINFGGDFQTSTNAVNLTEYNGLFAGVGIHPEDIDDAISRVNYSTELAELAQKNKVIAIGEIGLDYHFSTEFKQEQQEVFRMQLEWAIELNLPVMIHSRDATEDGLRILREFPGVRGVMHCYSGSNETAKEIIKMGLYLGIGGVITFKNSKLRENLAGIPLERLVLETDAPYMAPVPYRGQRNESRWMKYVAEVLADVYKTSFERINEVTTANAKQLFGIK